MVVLRGVFFGAFSLFLPPWCGLGEIACAVGRRRDGEEGCCRCGFEPMTMVLGGAGSAWGLAEGQSQVLVMTCFALRNTFSSLNVFSQWVKLNYVSTSERETEPPGGRRTCFTELAGFRSHCSHSAWVMGACLGGRAVPGGLTWGLARLGASGVI